MTPRAFTWAVKGRKNAKSHRAKTFADMDDGQLVAYFHDRYGIDLSDEPEGALDIYVRCEQQGVDPVNIFESGRRFDAYMATMTPEEIKLDEWETNFRRGEWEQHTRTSGCLGYPLDMFDNLKRQLG